MYRLRRAGRIRRNIPGNASESFLDFKHLDIEINEMSNQMETGKDISGIHLWLVLWKSFHSVEAHAHRHIASLNLGVSDFGVLEALFHKGPLTVKELGAKVLLTSGSMTAAIDRLESRGLVERGGDAKDRRLKVICLTRGGKQLIQKEFESHRLAMEKAASGLSPAERATLINLLRKLGKSAELD
jgi:MarR family transcriptional regulator, 2-MHQ and catechol-resistance regulon repressor